jgi:phospholipid transport system substrate-binding protein
MRFPRAILIVLCGLLLTAKLAIAAPSPQAQVQTTVDQVIETLQNKELIGAERRQALSSLIRARFDFQIMSQRTLGKQWKKASAEEQTRFVKLFSNLLEASYIGRVEAYTDEKVRYLGERIKGDRAEVATSIRTANAELPINYRMVLKGEEWFVYDVIVEDVSLIKNYRSSYGEIVRNEGFAGLFSRMEKKLEELHTAAGNSGNSPG